MASKGAIGAGISLFKTDDAIKAGVSAANSAGQAAFRKVLEASSAILTGSSESAARSAAQAGFPTKAAYDAAEALATRSLASATRLHAEAPDIVGTLTGCGLQDALASDVAMVALRRRDAITDALRATIPHHPTLASLRSRVDVAISSAALPKVMRPAVTLEMTTSDGAIRTFEVPTERFHELRYSVARLLSDMGALEGHPVLKIA